MLALLRARELGLRGASKISRLAPPLPRARCALHGSLDTGSMHTALHTSNCALAHCTHTAHYARPTAHFLLRSVQCAVCNVLCAVRSTLLSVRQASLPRGLTERLDADMAGMASIVVELETMLDRRGRDQVGAGGSPAKKQLIGIVAYQHAIRSVQCAVCSVQRAAYVESAAWNPPTSSTSILGVKHHGIRRYHGIAPG